MERRPRSGDTAFHPLNWPLLLLGYLGSFLARCHQLAVWGRGRAAGLSGPCEIPRQTGSSRGRVRTSSQDPWAPPDLPWPAVVMGGRPSGEGEEDETGINLGTVRCKAGMLFQGGPYWGSVVPETRGFWKAAEPA